MDRTFTIEMEKTGEMEFTTTFDKDYPPLLFDEPVESGGNDKYPNASRILTAAVANCMSASFTFCAKKAKIPLIKLHTEAQCKMGINEEGFWRIKQISVDINPTFDQDSQQKRKDRCLAIFKKYCIVSMSVINGIEVSSQVKL